MTEPIEVLFDRHVRDRYPRGRADLDAPGARGKLALTPWQFEFMVYLRDVMNRELANAKTVADHVVNGPYCFDLIDSDDQSAYAFTGSGHSFIGLTTGMSKWVCGAGQRLRQSEPVWRHLDLDQRRTDPNNLEFFFVYLATAFVVAHEFCHHVLGHQPDAIPQGDARTMSLRGNLQSHTREVAADGYAAMHQYAFVVHSNFRAKMVTLLSLHDQPALAQDRAIFLLTLAAVASTWYRSPPAMLTDDSIYFLSHPPRAARLGFFMEHAMTWCRAFHPTLDGVVDGQSFANLMHVVGEAVCAENADSSAQHAFLRSPEGTKYHQALLANLELHKSLMGGGR